MSEPKYQHISVQLVGMDGNAFAIIGRVRQALERAGVPSPEVDRFSEEAMAGDYDNVLQTCMRWVTVT